jgi:hypothetical protein
LLFRAACLALVLLVVTGLGTFGASAQSLPGDFLYPVKLAQENIQLTFAVNGASQARLHLEFAGRRLDEVMDLLEKNRTTGFEQALENYNSQIQAELQFLGQQSSLSASEQSGLAQSILSDVASHQARLASLTQEAPATVQGSIAAALAISQKAYSRAEEIILNPNDNNGGQAASTSTLNLGPSPTPVPPTREATHTPSLANPTASSRPPAQIPPTSKPGDPGTPMPTPEGTGTPMPAPEGTGTLMPTRGTRVSPPAVRVTPLPRNSQTSMPPTRTRSTLPDPKATATPRKTRTPWPRLDPWQTPTQQAPYP